MVEPEELPDLPGLRDATAEHHAAAASGIIFASFDALFGTETTRSGRRSWYDRGSVSSRRPEIRARWDEVVRPSVHQLARATKGDGRVAESNRFNEAAASWDESTRRVQMAAAIAAEIARRVPLSCQLDVLDFGCGTGLLTLALQPSVRRITGVDTSAGMLDVLRAKLRERRLGNVEAVLLEARGEPALPPGHCDLVVSSMALHHIEDVAPLFREFHARLHPGGRVALADLDREDGTFHEDPRGVFHFGFERGEVTVLLEEAGFADPAATTATVVRKNDREYPVFLITGTKRG